jgi:pyruvate,water dikinase
LEVLSRADPSLPDDRLVADHPVLLSLAPPSLVAPVALPRSVSPPTAAPRSLEPLPVREQLRLRVRWIQELQTHVIRELGHRLLERGVLADSSDLTLLTRADLVNAVHTGSSPSPAELHERRRMVVEWAFSPPLPAQFRLAPGGEVVPAERTGARPGAGTAAGGGRGAGTVVHGSVRRPPAPGEVLVVRDLEPGLAAFLPGLAGLVAETGATLSHLAIMAREYGVPTVVAVHDARRRFPPGTRLLVDGATGELTIMGEPGGLVASSATAPFLGSQP